MDAIQPDSGSQTLRVLHVVHSLQTGGMENGIVNMAQRLAPRGIIADVCCLTTKGAFASRLPKDSTVFELRKPNHFSLTTAWHLHQLVKRLRPHVVHSHNWSGLLYAVLSGCGPRLLQGEHAQLTAWEHAPRRLIWRRWLYAACAGLHTVSGGQRAELVGLGVAKANEVQVVMNGVDSDYFVLGEAKLARQSLGLPTTGLFFGMVARCIADKRHDRALAAFATIAADKPDAHLLFAGEGGNIRDQVLAAVRCHPYSSRIHWLGNCDDMRPVYQAMDLLMVPSEVEGLSNACLESMACGVPVLANAACGATEVIKEGMTGFIRPIRDANELAEALRVALTDLEDLRVMGGAARDDVMERFSISSMTDRYEQMYRTMAAGRSESFGSRIPSEGHLWIS